ncbi:uncharacterized protein ISCGN_009801 [Ixodes scapularis]
MDEDAQEPPTKKCRVEPQDAKSDPDPQVPSRESPPSGGPQAILPDPSPADCSGGGCGGGGDEEDDENAPVQVKYEVVEEVVAYESCSTMANDPDDEACDNPEPLVPLPAEEGEPTDGSPAGSPELAELRAEWPVSPSQAVPVGAREPLPNMYTLQLMDQQHMDMTGVCPEHMPYDYRMMTLNQGPPSEDFQDQPPPYLLAHGGGYSVRLLQDESQGDKLKGARVLVDGEVPDEVYPTLDAGQRTAAYAHHTVISSPGQQASYVIRDVSYALPQTLQQQQPQQPQQAQPQPQHQLQQQSQLHHQPSTHQSRSTRSSGRTRDRIPGDVAMPLAVEALNLVSEVFFNRIICESEEHAQRHGSVAPESEYHCFRRPFLQGSVILTTNPVRQSSSNSDLKEPSDGRPTETAVLRGRLKAARERNTDLERKLNSVSSQSQVQEKSFQEYLREIKRLKMEQYKSSKSIEELKQELSELSNKLGEKAEDNEALHQKLGDVKKELSLAQLYAQQLGGTQASENLHSQ